MHHLIEESQRVLHLFLWHSKVMAISSISSGQSHTWQPPRLPKWLLGVPFSHRLHLLVNTLPKKAIGQGLHELTKTVCAVVELGHDCQEWFKCRHNKPNEVHHISDLIPLQIVDALTLLDVEDIRQQKSCIAVAVVYGSVRLIDNLLLEQESTWACNWKNQVRSWWAINRLRWFQLGPMDFEPRTRKWEIDDCLK